LPTLQEELRSFPNCLLELLDLREDALSQLLSRPSADVPFVSGSRSTWSPVERVVIKILESKHATEMQRIVDACNDLYQLSPKADKELLKQFWRGRYTGDLPAHILELYAEVRTTPPEAAIDTHN
jgi:hypothetical protein